MKVTLSYAVPQTKEVEMTLEDYCKLKVDPYYKIGTFSQSIALIKEHS